MISHWFWLRNLVKNPCHFFMYVEWFFWWFLTDFSYFPAVQWFYGIILNIWSFNINVKLIQTFFSVIHAFFVSFLSCIHLKTMVNRHKMYWSWFSLSSSIFSFSLSYFSTKIHLKSLLNPTSNSQKCLQKSF